MNIELFKSNLNKGQLEALAIDTIKKFLESQNELEILKFAKKLKYFTEVLLKESEEKAFMIWEQQKSDHPEMSYTTGATILDYYQDAEYKDIAENLAARKDLLDLAFKSKDPIYDKDGIEVPKVPIKGYRKDSINVKI